MPRPLLAFAAPVSLPLAPAINTVLAAWAAAGPAAHDASIASAALHCHPPHARSRPAGDQR